MVCCCCRGVVFVGVMWCDVCCCGFILSCVVFAWFWCVLLCLCRGALLYLFCRVQWCEVLFCCVMWCCLLCCVVACGFVLQHCSCVVQLWCRVCCVRVMLVGCVCVMLCWCVV